MNIKWHDFQSIEHQIELFEAIEDNTSSELFWQELITSFIDSNPFKKLFSFNTINREFESIYFKNSKDKKLNTRQFSLDIAQLTKKLINEKEHENIFIFKVDYLITDDLYTFENITIGDAKQKSEGSSIYKNVSDFIKNNVTYLTLKNIYYPLVLNKISPVSAQNSTIEKILSIFNRVKADTSEFKKHVRNTVKNTVISVKAKGDDELSKKSALNDANKFLNEVLFFAHISHIYNVYPSLETDKKFDAKFVRLDTLNHTILQGSLKNEIVLPIEFSLQENISNNNSTKKLTYNLKNTEFPYFQKETEMHKRISKAINWYSSALKENQLHTSFLFYCIGLESLFSIEKSNPVTETLADSCALLLGSSIKNRITIKKNIKKIYNNRSNVAHGREVDVLNADIELVALYLKLSICNFIDLLKIKNITTNKELLEQFDYKKFDSKEFN